MPATGAQPEDEHGKIMATPAEQHTFRIFLRFLSVAQFSMAILAGGALAFVYMTYVDAANRAAHPTHAAELGALSSHQPAYVGLAVISALALVGGLVSGVCIWRQRWRGLSMGVSVVGLLFFPVGTVIGLATLVILGQKPVRDLYSA